MMLVQLNQRHMKTHKELTANIERLGIKRRKVAEVTGASYPTVKKWFEGKAEMTIGQAILLNDFLIK